MTFIQPILELQHCNKCNKTFALFFIHNEEKDMKIFGGYEIITYICSIKQIKQLDYARDTKNEYFGGSVKNEDF